MQESNYSEIWISNNTFLPPSVANAIVNLDKKVPCIRTADYDKKSEGFQQDLCLIHPRLMQQ